MELKYEITDHVGVISTKKDGWQREINFVSWNGRDPKLDIREWNEDHTRMGKGVTFSKDEAERMYMILSNYMRGVK